MGGDHLIGGVVVVAEVALLVLGLVGGAYVLGLVRDGSGGGGRDVGDGGALAAEIAGEEEEGDGAAENGGEEGHSERRHKRSRRRHLAFVVSSPLLL